VKTFEFANSRQSVAGRVAQRFRSNDRWTAAAFRGDPDLVSGVLADWAHAGLRVVLLRDVVLGGCRSSGWLLLLCGWGGLLAAAALGPAWAGLS